MAENNVLKDKLGKILNPKIPRYEKFRRKFESGEILTNQMTNGEIGGITGAYYNLTFKKSYNTVPKIILEPRTKVDNMGFVQTLVDNLSTTGCRIWINSQPHSTNYSIMYFIFED